MPPLSRRFLGWLFGLLYNQLAWTYDLVSWTVSIGQWRSWQRTALPYLRGRPILEIGHGTGNMLLDLAGLGLKPVGLDLSPGMGRIAGRKLRRALGPASQPALVRGRAQALPFARDSFASLLATFPTEFVGQIMPIAEFFRVLRPGGVLVSVPSAQITGVAPTERLAEWLFRVTGQSAETFSAPLVERFERAGFQARLERVTLPRSIVTIVIAEKA